MLSRDFQEEAWGEGTNAGGLSVTPVESTDILNITLESSNPQQGEALLNELINLFDERTEEQYECSIELINDDLQLTVAELQEIYQRIEQTQGLLDGTGISEMQQSELLNTLSRFFQQRDKLLEKKLQSKQKLNTIESMQVLEKPAASSVPVSPNKKMNIVLAGVLGLMVGVFAAFTVDYFRRNPLTLNNN
jgi:capsular polysaccharide biosynthesis protein